MSQSRATRWVAVDDKDPAITYTGSWTETRDVFDTFNRFGPPHEGSQHVTTSSGSFSFPFRGSRVQVFGTNHQVNTTTTIDPLWECSVDGVDYGPRSGYPDHLINSWLLCSVTFIGDDDHILTVSANSSSSPFYVDLIQYRPAFDQRNTLYPTVFIDDTDPAVRFLEGDWRTHGNQTRLTESNNAKVRVDFNGTRATWVGWIPDGFGLRDSEATYTIDGGNPVSFVVPALPTAANGTLYYQPFFETPILTRGAHALEVVYKGPSAPFSLDYLIVENSDIFLPGDLPPAGGGIGGGGGNGTIPDDPIPDAPTPSNEPKAKKAPIGAIVGGAVGGVVLIAIVAILVFFALKKRKGAKSQATQSEAFNTPLSTGNASNQPPMSRHSGVPLLQPTLQTGPNPAVMMNPSMVSMPNSMASAAANGVPTYFTQATNPALQGSYPSGLQQHQRQQGQLLSPNTLTPQRQSVMSSSEYSFASGNSSQAPMTGFGAVPGYVPNNFAMMDGSDAPQASFQAPR